MRRPDARVGDAIGAAHQHHAIEHAHDIHREVRLARRAAERVREADRLARGKLRVLALQERAACGGLGRHAALLPGGRAVTHERKARTGLPHEHAVGALLRLPVDAPDALQAVVAGLARCYLVEHEHVLALRPDDVAAPVSAVVAAEGGARHPRRGQVADRFEGGQPRDRLEEPVAHDHERVVLHRVGHEVAAVEEPQAVLVGEADDRVPVRV